MLKLRDQANGTDNGSNRGIVYTLPFALVLGGWSLSETVTSEDVGVVVSATLADSPSFSPKSEEKKLQLIISPVLLCFLALGRAKTSRKDGIDTFSLHVLSNSLC